MTSLHVKVGGAWHQIGGGTGGEAPFDPENTNWATGGSIQTLTDFNGSGETWRVHFFTSNGTFTVERNPHPFDIVLVGGGASGGSNLANWNGGRHGGGGGGGVISRTIWGPEGSPGPIELPLGALAVQRGAGAGAASNGSQPGGGTWVTLSGALVADLQAFGGGRAASGNTEPGGAPTSGTGGGNNVGAPGVGVAGQGTDGNGRWGGSGLWMPTRILTGVDAGNWAKGAGLSTPDGVTPGDPITLDIGDGGQGTRMVEFGAAGRNGIAVFAYRIA